MEKVQLLSKPDGNILQLLTDPRMITLAVGSVAGAVLEKSLFSMNRAAFGYAINTPAGVQYFASYEEYNAKKPANPKFGTNRQLARVGIVVGCVAGIEYIPEKTGGLMQYTLAGIAAVTLAHAIQEIFPSLK
ncbi:hypothetical protein [Deinococcus cellulosilyticus]|uniref:Uncharacterized protein n=1 Tax=Deinococcus cellulosilyticus (strain DSM 18568 / NBRC 106333 / KACC 11606 / 5516J-15) TaxID=1223518 RepID=A0A511MXI6_DEIC1|nr:hypothetical protein [Deinococcus cellulosilyticus]GEM45312.1 hypothetical protein DC3_09470 [Deinococcus cellulosilyticus NBRC 106333 = KACC 11606]